MITLAACLLIAILLFLSGLHVYWAAGGKWSSSAVIPTRPDGDIFTFTPPPIATFAVAAALLTAALLVVLRLEWLTLPLPAWMANNGVWAIAIVFAFRALGEFRYVGLFKRVRDTDFGRMDTRVYTPLCILLSALAFIVSLS